MSQFKKFFLSTSVSIVAVAFLLSGCIKSAEEKTHTVSEYLHDGDLYEKTRLWCINNPGERWMLPNCLNVGQAGGIKSNSSCFSKNQIDHDCLDKKGFKR
jgi:hypothetical protein